MEKWKQKRDRTYSLFKTKFEFEPYLLNITYICHHVYSYNNNYCV